MPEEYPHVTVQLPVYNELYVIERLIETVANFDYPSDKLEIQVLDDSTDETVEIIANKIKEIVSKGIDIIHVRRPERKGFKAGALAYGTDIAKGEFIAIFDADFVPRKDFLLKTIPYFKNEKIGVVQTKWEHLNEDYSMLTKLQAFGLDAHFTVEQVGRNSGGHFINFNGTAGIWRKECIYDAGGWQSDTLTEDLDLSYRAQGRGWEFKYLEDFGSPAELPAVMNALKSQQYRWTKGAAETARKNLWKVFKSKSISFNTKIHALFHLMNSFIFICIVTTALLSVPVLWIKHDYPEYNILFNIAAVLLLSLIFLSIYYYMSRLGLKSDKGKASREFIKYFPMFLSVSMGLSLHNAVAVFEGYIGRKTPFVRTPKFNVNEKSDSWKNNKYASVKISPIIVFEFLFALYALGGIVYGIIIKDFGLMPYHLMLLVGFSFVFIYSLKDYRLGAK